MPKFHINSKGDVASCRATKRACRFGEDSHFENFSEALIASEKRLAEDSGSNIESYKKDTFDPRKVSRVKNVDNLIQSKSRLEDFGKSVRFHNSTTIEDVEITARNAAYTLRNSSQWSPSIKVRTNDANQTITFCYNRSEDLFEVKELDPKTFMTKKIFSSKRQEDAMLYIADNYRYDD